jgi:hypothetical protein
LSGYSAVVLDASAQLRQAWFFVFYIGHHFGRLVRGSPTDNEWHNAGPMPILAAISDGSYLNLERQMP